MKKFVLIAVLALCQNILYADALPRRAAGGMASEFKSYKFMPAESPKLLPLKILTNSDRKIVEQAESMFERNSTLSIVMVEKGQLVFEKYRAPSGPLVPNFSWSMSKSLTGYTIGEMSCNGQITDLDRSAQSYSADLRSTVYGEATVKNLLTMSSGVKDAVASGNQMSKTSGCTVGIDCDDWQLQRSQIMSGLETLKAFPTRESAWGSPVASGSKFSYNGNDTQSLSNIADNNGGFIESFTKHIWSQAGAESPAYWMLDKDNRAISQAGFSASSRDWARLAMFTIKQRRAVGTCIGDFMTAATSPQIGNSARRYGAAFPSYGYQTWIGNFGGKSSYWWVGYGGQRVGIDPESERIIVVTSWRENYMTEVYRLWNNWNNLNN